MTPQQKITLKRVAVGVGVLLIITAIVIIIYKQSKPGEEEEEPGEKKKLIDFLRPNRTEEIDASKYSKTEIQQMQSWLISTATSEGNTYIPQRIRETGGIDGRIGPGFTDAVNEAIKQDYIKDIDDLYNKTK